MYVVNVVQRISALDSPNRSVYATIRTRLRTNFNHIIFTCESGYFIILSVI